MTRLEHNDAGTPVPSGLTAGMTVVILSRMKIGVSLPDDLCRRVDREAQRLGLSRSELLARAASEFLSVERGRAVTESYDRAFGEDDAEERAFRREAARRALQDVEW